MADDQQTLDASRRERLAAKIATLYPAAFFQAVAKNFDCSELTEADMTWCRERFVIDLEAELQQDGGQLRALYNNNQFALGYTMGLCEERARWEKVGHLECDPTCDGTINMPAPSEPPSEPRAVIVDLKDEDLVDR